jgi:FAD/FMN-containing dehydrogenase
VCALLRYGMMREQVLGLEVVLADGTLVTSLNKMLKNNAGYDLKQLFIGAEGTLGVVTRAVLRLWPQPASITTVLVGCQHFKQVTGLLAHTQAGLGALLVSFEVMWNDYYRLTTTPPAPTHPPLSQDHAYYVLIEAMGSNPMQDRECVQNELEKAFERGLCNDAVVARSQQKRADLWRIREDSEQLEKQFSPIYGFDVSLPIVAMERYVAEVRHALAEQAPRAMCWVYGHLADGNLHINVWAPAGDAAVRRRVEEIVYRPLAAVGGSVSAEHGIGMEKREYLSWCRSEAEITLMRRLKAALDPTNILNPGKVLEP